VGWSLGPAYIIAKMKGILSHLGAWSPMAEQKATAQYLLQTENIQKYLLHFKAEVEERLRRIYEGFKDLKNEGFAVDAVSPQAAIYLTVKVDLSGKTTAGGKALANQAAVTDYLLSEAKIALVPFHIFGADRESPWYRLSVGTSKKEEIGEMIGKLREALLRLK